MDKLEFVVIRNLNKTPSSFIDHAGRPQNLMPVMQSGDTVKIMVGPDDIQAAKRYQELKTTGYAVVLSEGLEDILKNMNPTTKMFIETNSNAAPDVVRRAEFLRQDTENKALEDRAAAGRLARARAMATLKEKSPQTPSETKPEVKLSPKTAPVPTEVAEAIHSLGDDQGEEISEASLSTKPMAELKALAVELKIQIPAGVSKNTLVQLIVAEVNKVDVTA